MKDLLNQSQYTAFRSVRYFGSLDGLRCLSIVAVIWCHAVGDAFEHAPGLALLTHGSTGVELFFVISGFLITTLLLRERESCGEVSLKMFYARRVLRIFPLYFTVLGIYACLIAIRDLHDAAGRLFFANLPYYLTYTSNIFVDLAINDDGQRRVPFIFAWSLATEEQFYLVWPLLLRYLKKWWPFAILAASLMVSQAVAFGQAGHWFQMHHRLFRGITSISAAICLGVALAHLLHSPRGYELARRLVGWRFSPVAALAVVAAVLSIPGDGPGWSLGVDMAMVLLVATCVIREDHVVSTVFSSRLFRRIGLVSYGMYMLHMLALHAVDAGLGPLGMRHRILRFVLGLLVAYALASLSYRYYEGWFLKLKGRFERRRDRGSVDQPAPAPAPAPAEPALT